MNNNSTDAFSATINSFYEAAFNIRRWRNAIRSLNTILDGDRSTIICYNGETLRIVFSSDASDLSSNMVPSYLEQGLLTGHEWHEPIGRVYRFSSHGLRVNLLSTAETVWFLDLQRDERNAGFAIADIQLLSSLVPHLIRAYELSNDAGALWQSASAILHPHIGLVFTNRNRKILRLNAAAELILSLHNCPLSVKDGHLAASTRKEAKLLAQLIDEVCATEFDSLNAGGILVFSGQCEDVASTRLIVSVSPVTQAMLNYGLASEPCAAVILRDLTPRAPDGFDILMQSIFGLSPSEARLAGFLLAGRSLQDAAAATNLTITTARTYLTRIFRKTKTTQQSQLVAMIKTIADFPRMS